MNRRMWLGLFGIGILAIGVGQMLPSATTEQPTRESTIRLLSLSPSITETIYNLGASELLVGRSDYCNNPPQATSLSTYGTSLTPNLEAIARTAPDMVIVDGSLANPVDSLRAITTVEVLPWLQTEEVTASIQKLGQMIDKEAAATQLAKSIEDALQPTVKDGAPRMLAVMTGSDLSKGPIWYLRPDSLHGTAMAAAGFANAQKDPPSGPPSLPIEALIQLDPDLIVFINQGELTAEETESMRHGFDHLTPLKAVSEGRVGVVSGTNILGTGPGIVDFVTKLHDTGNALMGPS